YLDVAGTYILTLKSGGTTGTLSVNGRDPNNKLKMNTTVGADIGNLRAQVTWGFRDGFDVTPTTANLQQTRTKSFSIFNLFFKYDVPGESDLLKDLSFTL